MRMSHGIRLLVIDDEVLFLQTLERIFTREGMTVLTATHGRQGLEILGQQAVDVVLCDILMPEMDGLEFLEKARELSPAPEVLMLTAHATVETAVSAMKQGAYDYLQKPADINDVERAVRRAYEKVQLARQNSGLRRMLGQTTGRHSLVGESEAIRGVREMIERVAPTQAHVLILGESGVGKELVARQVHALGPRRDFPFLTVDCGALASSLLENELFGHVAGAYTGAGKSARGLFEEADQGTLLIDEIGEMPLDVQSRFLRVLESGEFKRLGEARTRVSRARIVAATNRDLEQEAAKGNFRQDLFFRLNVFPIHVPPLRARREDIPLLVEHLLSTIDPRAGSTRKLSAEAMKQLSEHHWPGNVRELKNALERGVIMARGEKIEIEDLPPLSFSEMPERRGRTVATEAVSASPKSSYEEGKDEGESDFRHLAEVEREHIRRALLHSGGVKTRAAHLLGISLRSLYTRLARYDLE